ncbi:hypothetical protein B0J17DRAFT_652268 [Rhizoctonia solani]|nr:hypothetical protein B0J17DRAFT_652268 [Rhizoctonia solani]
MRGSIVRRQDPTTTSVGGTTQNSTPTSEAQSPEETTTPRTSNSPSQTTPTLSSTEDSIPTSTRTTPTTTNEPTSTRQTSTSTPTTQSATSRTETSEPQTSTSSPGTSTSPISQSATPSVSVTATQSEITSTSFPSITSSTSPIVSSTPRSISLSTTSNTSTLASDTQTSSPTSISSSTPDPSTSPTSSPAISTSVSGSDTSNASSTPTPAPSPTPASSTTPVRESSTASDSASSSTLTSVLITTVTTVNGQLTTLTTIVPTLATSPQESSGISARSSKIVGGVVGGTLALLGVLLALFYVSRRRRKVAAVRDAPRLQAPRQMLDADDFDLAEPGPTPYAYGMVGARANPNASGSIFHEALPGTSSQPSHSYSRSVVSENDPLLAHHMRGGSADIDSVTTSSPRESTHFRASSTTGLLYDPNDPFGDHPPRSVGSSSSRPHPLAVNKASEARSRGSDQHVYPPSAYRGPTNSSDPLSTSSPVLVHQDAGRVDMLDTSAPPAYGSAPR